MHMSIEPFVQLFIGFLVAFLVFCFVFGIVMYIFEAIGVYTFCRRRNIRLSGFAWVPILRLFKFGQLSDDAILNKSGRTTHMMVLYPVFYIAGLVVTYVGAFVSSVSVGLTIDRLFMVFQNPENARMLVPQVESEAGFVIGTILSGLGLILSIAATVFQYYCVFHIFRSCSAKFIVMFILVFFFPFLIAIFLFATRKQDNPAWYIPGRNRNVENSYY